MNADLLRNPLLVGEPSSIALKVNVGLLRELRDDRRVVGEHVDDAIFTAKYILNERGWMRVGNAGSGLREVTEGRLLSRKKEPARSAHKLGIPCVERLIVDAEGECHLKANFCKAAFSTHSNGKVRADLRIADSHELPLGTFDAFHKFYNQGAIKLVAARDEEPSGGGSKGEFHGV